MNTYVITLTTADGELFRYTHHGDYTPYMLLDDLAARHNATYVKCHVTNEGWYLEKEYSRE